MNLLQFKRNYSKVKQDREQLYILFQEVFQIDPSLLRDFYERGFWNETYEPYTYFASEKAIANVSMFSMPLLVEGKIIKAAGIQSVMSHPDYRGKGLMKQLFTKMLETIDEEYDCMLLMTDNPKLYIPFGFRELQQSYFSARIFHEKKTSTLKKLDFFSRDDLKLIQTLMGERQPLSRRFWPLAYDSSFYLNMYHSYFNKNLYYSKELGAIMIFEVNEETCRLYDVIAKEIPALEELVSHIPEQFINIQCYFCPDQFKSVNWKPEAPTSKAKLMLRGDLSIINQPIKLPITAEF
ncbi:GNAT family N-acetyltransferase [Lederbergia citrea]|uniref:GNAT family N-acetyltransferase n=1 Tax=Lederbergia citrea TaxID=2833581 RepID=UPI001BC9E352|nr:GNAT family N-acetyltransferase [Lederbergia citrea]MBS4178634.1 GNAT family N-acetyltransferase [Lederbergia citrea]